MNFLKLVPVLLIVACGSVEPVSTEKQSLPADTDTEMFDILKCQTVIIRDEGNMTCPDATHSQPFNHIHYTTPTSLLELMFTAYGEHPYDTVIRLLPAGSPLHIHEVPFDQHKAQLLLQGKTVYTSSYSPQQEDSPGVVPHSHYVSAHCSGTPFVNPMTPPCWP